MGNGGRRGMEVEKEERKVRGSGCSGQAGRMDAEEEERTGGWMEGEKKERR